MFKSQKYTTIFYLSVVHTLKNFKVLIGLSVFLITCLLIFSHLWSVASANIGALALRPDQLLWYIALNEWVLIALPDVQDDMEHHLRSGRLAYLLPRPISYLGATFFEGVGVLCVNLLVLGIVAFLFSWIKSGVFPFTLIGFTFTLLFGLLAGAVSLIFQMVIGISAFWLHQVGPFYWIWEKLLFTLGGLILPLAIYPGWLQNIAACTPFPLILGERSFLIMGFTFHSALSLMGGLLVWGVGALLLLTLLYRKGLCIINMEGG